MPAGNPGLAGRAVLVRGLAASILVIVTLGALVQGTESAVSGLASTADRQIAQSAHESADLVAADLIDVDNDFVQAAETTVPVDARYAVLLPADPAQAQKTYGVLPVTLQGLPDFMRTLLLPRRDVDAGNTVTPRVQVGTWVLCYYCDTSPWDPRTHWRWNSNRGTAIGQVYR